MINKNTQDWKILEFSAPISEANMFGDNYLIKGTAINETTTRNGVKYIAEELEKAAPSFRNKPILLDHKNEIKNIVGRTTENVHFDRSETGMGKIQFEAMIMDKEIQQMITDKRIQEVSIGAGVKDLVEEEDGSMKALGLEGMEISLVAVPGDPGASLATAMVNGFQIKEALKLEKKIVNINNTDGEKGELSEDDSKGGANMTEEETKVDAPKEEVKDEAEAPVEEPVAEESSKMKALDEKFTAIQIKLKEMEIKQAEEKLKTMKEDAEAEVAEPKAEEPKAEEPADETKGEVGEPAEEESAAEEGYALERAENGRGFSLYKDYQKEGSDSKLKRLVR